MLGLMGVLVLSFSLCSVLFFLCHLNAFQDGVCVDTLMLCVGSADNQKFVIMP